MKEKMMKEMLYGRLRCITEAGGSEADPDMLSGLWLTTVDRKTFK